MPSNTEQEGREPTLSPILNCSPEQQDRFETASGIELGTVYTPEDIPDFDYVTRLGYPGEPPFTRGIQPNMYRDRIRTR